MFHDTVELIKALAWPLVTVFLVLRFESRISSVLKEVPSLVRRMRSAHGLGVEIELDKLDGELPVAERQALELALQPLPEPKEE